MSKPKQPVKKIGFDLDGVIVAGPPLVPKSLLERCFRGGASPQSLDYCFPRPWQQRLRCFFHQPLFRPAIKNNLAAVKELATNPNYELYLISARYSFLIPQTNHWLSSHQIDNIFDQVILNQDNQPPHLFKQRILQRLNLAVYFEDDEAIASFLKENIKQTKTVLVNSHQFDFKDYL